MRGRDRSIIQIMSYIYIEREREREKETEKKLVIDR